MPQRQCKCHPPCWCLRAFAMAATLIVSTLALAQGRQHSEQWRLQQIESGVVDLKRTLASHPDVNRRRESNAEHKGYLEEIPAPDEWVVSLLVNPCGANGTRGREDHPALGYDCCDGQYGQGELSWAQKMLGAVISSSKLFLTVWKGGDEEPFFERLLHWHSRR
mmetsp:Transcript_31852/g.72132  ORF Transcript_31852/g.72132 Transcript_31852/m.72132 type:complete len:164 (+) Transcript_31852:110-601(+)